MRIVTTTVFSAALLACTALSAYAQTSESDATDKGKTTTTQCPENTSDCAANGAGSGSEHQNGNSTSGGGQTNGNNTGGQTNGNNGSSGDSGNGGSGGTGGSSGN